MDVVADIKAEPKLESDELWFQDAIIYQLHVKAFADSNNDGMGDFAGLTEKLDYLEDLGVTALWLLPFYPSPGRDDGYDISDYLHINPDFGTMQDFRRFMQEARRRKLRVITELVINHTSDQHPWFQRARRSRPTSDARNWYVWSDHDQAYAGTRVIFNDTENRNHREPMRLYMEGWTVDMGQNPNPFGRSEQIRSQRSCRLAKTDVA